MCAGVGLGKRGRNQGYLIGKLICRGEDEGTDGGCVGEGEDGKEVGVRLSGAAWGDCKDAEWRASGWGGRVHVGGVITKRFLQFVQYSTCCVLHYYIRVSIIT